MDEFGFFGEEKAFKLLAVDDNIETAEEIFELEDVDEPVLTFDDDELETTLDDKEVKVGFEEEGELDIPLDDEELEATLVLEEVAVVLEDDDAGVDEIFAELEVLVVFELLELAVVFAVDGEEVEALELLVLVAVDDAKAFDVDS